MALDATFIHPLYGEWIATPKKVILQKTTHPQEANLQRQRSNVAARKDGTIEEKTKKTNLERYGVPYSCQTESTKQKSEQTCLTKYGCLHALSNQTIRLKGAETRATKYGDANYHNVEATKKTNLERYGFQNAMSNPHINQKAILTKEKKGLITRPRGKSWQELAIELGVPRTTLQAFIKNDPSEESIEDFLSKREQNYSDIESVFSQALSTSKYTGQAPGGIPYRPDFKVGDVYVNVDGLYWHSQKNNRKSNYHFALREAFEKQGCRIMQFRSDEVKFKIDIIKSMLQNINKTTVRKVYARKCRIEDIKAEVANEFLSKNHMMGESNSRFIGLKHEDKLVSVMGFKVKNNVLDIDRFASLIDHSIVGGLSKMLSYLKTLHTSATSINYWVDLRYGTGKSLEKIGFTHQRDVQSWQWTDFKKTYHRSKCRANMDSRHLTQAEHAKELGLWQIYDAGQRLYIYKIL